MSQSISPPLGQVTFDAVTLPDATTYVLVATLAVGSPGVLVIQGTVGAGEDLSALKISRSLLNGGTPVTLVENGDIAPGAAGILSIGNTGMASFKAADNIAQLMGGIDNFQKGVASFIGHFYSGAEQHAGPPRSVEHTPVSGSTSSTARAASRSPATAAAMERTCS